MATPSIKLRVPSALHIKGTARTALDPLAPEFLSSQWYVTHSSLPMWRDARNVRIQYKILSNDGGIDDTVTYQPINATNIKTISGIDKPDLPGSSPETSGDGEALAWTWRGKGWLKLITSHWEILGHGVTPSGERWALTYFDKTMFTTAGIDVYGSSAAGVGDEFLEELKNALKALDNPALQKLVDDLFEVKRDDGN